MAFRLSRPPAASGPALHPLPREKRRVRLAILWSLALVVGCSLGACKTGKSRGAQEDFPEPRGADTDPDFWDQPRAGFSRARLGDADAIHEVFQRVLQIESGTVTTDSYQYDIRALRDAMGDERFFAALARESRDIQIRVGPYAPR